MIGKIIERSVAHPVAVLFGALMLALAGVYGLLNTPRDAIPDLADVQVIIYTDYPEQSPQVVEAQITYPLTTALRGVPRAKVVRGYSSFGLSFVYVIFADGTDPYWARSRVAEYLSQARARLPVGITPQIGTDASSVGWVYQYALVDKSGRTDLSQLRSLQDWYLRYELQSVPGVAEVASIGGFVKQYQVEVDPLRLAAHGVSLPQLREAIRRGNRDVGGRVLEISEMEYMVRGLGLIRSVADIENIALGVNARGTPVRVKDVAHVTIGPELRRGLAEMNGEGETVGGIVVMRRGENAPGVIAAVKQRLEELKPGLPAGVEVVPVYDRSDLIGRAMRTLSITLIEEIIVVGLVCLLFLMHARSALVAAVTLPLGILFSFAIMRVQGLEASIMSLGGLAIAIGAMIDAALVMIENAHKHLERGGTREDRRAVIVAAAKQVGPSLFFCLLIITVSFLPILALEAQEGRLFAPLAYTKTYAMAGAAMLSITLVPVLMLYVIRGRLPRQEDNPVNRFAMSVYLPALNAVLRHKQRTLAVALVLLFLSLWPWLRMGGEFMPSLNEGDLLYMPTTFPEVSVTKVRELLQRTDRIIKAVPEVKSVFGKAGRADTATDPAPMMMLETTIQLKDPSEWRPGMTREKLIDELNRAVRMPGVTNSWLMPIKARIEMLNTGIRTPLGVKVAGPDVRMLESIGRQVEQVVKQVSGSHNVVAERVASGRYLDIEIDRVAAGRYGLMVDDIQEVIASAIGGENVTTTIEGLERYPVNVRYARALRDSPEAVARVLVPLRQGGTVPLGQVAQIRLSEGPVTLRSENTRLNTWVYIDVAGRDLGSFLKEARRAVSEQVKLPPGYSLAWSGEYEHLARVAKRMWVVIPLTLLVIFLLLYLNFKEFTRPLIVMLSLPFALIGGLWLVYVLGYSWSVAVAVGFIAAAGVAAETGVVMLLYLDLAYDELRAQRGAAFGVKDLYSAVRLGAVERLRPKLMTVTAIIAGLLPLMWGSGAGSEVMRRIAAPMVGGMLTSTLLTLLVIPVIYALYRERLLTGASTWYRKR